MSWRRPHWIWAGRIAAVTCIAALAVYLSVVGLDKADKLASTIGVIVTLVALLAPYLLPESSSQSTPHPPQPAAPTQPAAPPAEQKIDLRKARGVQVNLAGEHTQTNTFTESP